MVIIRGKPFDPETQIGFYGSPQEIYQQLREQEEGYPLSLRWSLFGPQIGQNHSAETHTMNRRKSEIFGYPHGRQTCLTKRSYLLRNCDE
ncbi:MAG: hypothetical protein ACOYYS_12950 [Chloroflexota bacterium]